MKRREQLPHDWRVNAAGWLLDEEVESPLISWKVQPVKSGACGFEAHMVNDRN